MNTPDKLYRWFVGASVLHGLGIAVWSGLFLLDGIGIPLNLSRIIAGGGVGTWFTVGYFLYLITGFVGMAVQGFLYYVISESGGRLFSGKLAAAHFVLMNIAVMGATWMLGYAGFVGGTLTLEGREAEVHTAIVRYVNPIGYCILTGVISALIGAFNILKSLENPSIK